MFYERYGTNFCQGQIPGLVFFEQYPPLLKSTVVRCLALHYLNAIITSRLTDLG